MIHVTLSKLIVVVGWEVFVTPPTFNTGGRGKVFASRSFPPVLSFKQLLLNLIKFRINFDEITKLLGMVDTLWRDIHFYHCMNKKFKSYTTLNSSVTK